MKIGKYTKDNYLNFNKVMIVLILSMVFLPIIVYVIRLLIPNMIRCPYYELTYNPCPFCGITSDFRNILKGNIFAFKYNILSVPLLIIGIVELIVRCILIKNIKKNFKTDFLSSIIKYDICIHIIGFCIILTYCVLFITLNLRRF